MPLPKTLRIPGSLSERIEAHRDPGESGAELLNRVLAAGVEVLDEALARAVRPELHPRFPELFTVPLLDPRTGGTWIQLTDENGGAKELVSDHREHLEFAVVGLALMTRDVPKDDPSFFLPWISRLGSSGGLCALPAGFQGEGMSLGRWLVYPGDVGTFPVPLLKTEPATLSNGSPAAWRPAPPSLSSVLYCRYPQRVSATVRICAPNTRPPEGMVTPFQLSLVACRLGDGPLFERE